MGLRVDIDDTRVFDKLGGLLQAIRIKQFARVVQRGLVHRLHLTRDRAGLVTGGEGEIDVYRVRASVAVRYRSYEFDFELFETLKSQLLAKTVHARDGNVGGTGKTALLSYLASRAEQMGWLSVNVSCLPGMLQDILEQVYRKGSEYLDEPDNKRLSGVTFGQVVAVEWENQPVPTRNWRSEMTDVLQELNSKGIGLLITVDEVDPSLDEMIQLASVYQHFVREERTVGLLMAGLPYKVSTLLRNKSVSFLRRASQYRIGRIDDEEIAAAFKSTVEAAGSAISDDALALAVESIDGFPFMMQLVGFRSWEDQGERGMIDEQSVEKGVHMARIDMENRILRPTLDELSDMDIEFLNAMLEDDQASSSEDIATRLGKTPSYVTTYRKRLLEQGILEMQGRSKVRIALPGVREYLPEYLA